MLNIVNRLASAPQVPTKILYLVENFKDFVGEIFERKLAEGREIIKSTLSKIDGQIMKTRDTKKYRDKGLRSTSIKTKLGTIEYK